MAYSQTKQMTEIEKRMQTLKLQLHGKPQTLASFSQPSASITTPSVGGDLLKTVVTATGIILAQFAIYLSIERGLIRI